MKIIILLMLTAALLFSVTACSSEAPAPAETQLPELLQPTDTPTPEPTEAAPLPAGDYDVDLTQLSSTLVYSEVSNMMTAPEDYIGKSVRMQGDFAVYEDEASGNVYLACIIQDATACCAQGIEFVPTGDWSYPEDFPELGTQITVSGTFGTYSEGEQMYVTLFDAEMTV